MRIEFEQGFDITFKYIRGTSPRFSFSGEVGLCFWVLGHCEILPYGGGPQGEILAHDFAGNAHCT